MRFDEERRYDPGTDHWADLDSVLAPAARYQHATGWTGDEMVVWGGSGPLGYLQGAASYQP